MKYHLPFGTHGIRGPADRPPFTATHLSALGTALELFLSKNNQPARILIGLDTRESGPRILDGLLRGFSHLVTVCNAGVIPTPTLITLLTQKPEFNLGIMITASHNGAHDNGIKFFLQHGTDLNKSDEQRIQDLFDLTFSETPHKNALSCSVSAYPSAYAEYLAHIQPHFAPKFLAGITVGLDCAHGSASTYAPDIFTHFGATVVAINNSPNGTNINAACGSTHPENLQNLMLAQKCMVGFAFDGDADRVVAINHAGKIKDGDDLLVMLASANAQTEKTVIVSTKVSNSALGNALHTHNAVLISSDVGEHAVVEQMKKHNAPIGSEPSGHIVIRKHLMASDGIFAALCVMQAALARNNLALTTFEHNPHALENIRVAEKIPLAHPALAAVLASFTQTFPAAFQVVRYSGTESLLRVYVEAETQDHARFCASILADQLSTSIQTLSSPENAESSVPSAVDQRTA